MEKEAIIKADGLGKCYQIYARPVDRLKQSFWRGRRKYYREFWALKDASFQIVKNETVGIIGSNGSGKSTLLQLVSRILKPTCGDLYVQGRIAALLELGAGFNPEFTGSENIRINAAVLGLNPVEISERFEEIIRFADIGEFIDQPVKRYSSGMHVRLAFSIAVHVSPEILIIDEALAVGDARFRLKCMQKIREFCSRGTTLLVSHDMTAIKELCSRVIWVEGGKIQLDGEPKLVVDKYLEFMYEGATTDEEKRSNDEGMTVGSESVKTSPFDIEHFTLISGEERQFGNGRAVIKAIRVQSEEGALNVLQSGKDAEINLLIDAKEEICMPIVGFIVRDTLGREVIGDNSALIGRTLLPFQQGERYLVKFMIQEWPNLLEGEYAIGVAIADGTFEAHEQCHWVHDAVIVKSMPIRKPGALFSVIHSDVRVETVGH